MKASLLSLFLLLVSVSFSQKDSLSENYYERIILYSDLGYNSCPFSISYNHANTTYFLSFKNNIKPFVGFGGHYKWGALRIGTLLNLNLRGTNKYGETSIFKIGTEVTYKRFFFDIDLYKIEGYALLKNNNIGLNSNLILPDLSLKSTSVNGWFFFNKNFSLNALKGRKMSVNKFQWTTYIKETNVINSIDNQNGSFIPYNLQNGSTTESSFNKVKSFEVGIVPGLGLANKTKKIQYGALMGLGGVIIDKSIHFNQTNRNYIGFSYRYDFHLFVGYNVKKYFFMNYWDIENRWIDFNNISINQQIVSYRFIAGYRF